MNAPPVGTILSREDRAGVATLTLNDPASRNSLSEAMMAALSAALTGIAADRSVRAVVLAAIGPCFSSGHNLKELTARRADADRGRTYFTDIMGRCSALMQQIVALPQPLIAAVQGLATAAGCQLVATCDLAVASAAARFCTPGVHIGLFCSTPMVALSRAVGRKTAMEMLLTGDPIDAQRARAEGLVNRVVPADEVMDAAMALAARIAEASRPVVGIGKRAFYAQAEMPVADAYAYASGVMVANAGMADAREGICAFLEKRAPEWRHA